MKFLHITRSVLRESGGPAEGLRRILDGYTSLGYTAEVLSLDRPVDVPNDYPVPLHVLRTWQHKYGFSPQARIWLRANAGRFTGIVVHGLWQYQGLLALQELAGRHRYLVFTHGMLDPWFNRTYPMKFLKKLPYWMLVERRVLAAASHVLFTSTVEEQLAIKSFPLTRLHPAVVPYGTSGPPKRLGVEDESAVFYTQTGLAPDEPYLLYAGRIHEKKGCDLLVAAYAIVSRQVQLPRLVMAGPDQTRLSASLQESARNKGVADRILWPGMLTGPAKWEAFTKAEAFVLPSHQENFGIAVAEALSCSTPVLISDQVNIHADVTRCGAGYVAPDTLDGTVELLHRWAQTSAQDRAALRLRSVSCWRSNFDSAGTSRAIAALFTAEPIRHRTHDEAAIAADRMSSLPR